MPVNYQKNLPMRSVRIYTDGGARGNPGPAAIGIVIRDLESDEEIRHGEVIGVTTNNQAEYRALLWALQKAASLGIEQVECYLDSELVVKQMRREYRVRDQALGVIFLKVWNTLSAFRSVSFHQIPRSKNKEADSLVNAALDA